MAMRHDHNPLAQPANAGTAEPFDLFAGLDPDTVTTSAPSVASPQVPAAADVEPAPAMPLETIRCTVVFPEKVEAMLALSLIANHAPNTYAGEIYIVVAKQEDVKSHRSGLIRYVARMTGTRVLTPAEAKRWGWGYTDTLTYHAWLLEDLRPSPRRPVMTTWGVYPVKGTQIDTRAKA